MYSRQKKKKKKKKKKVVTQNDRKMAKVVSAGKVLAKVREGGQLDTIKDATAAAVAEDLGDTVRAQIRKVVDHRTTAGRGTSLLFRFFFGRGGR